MGCQLPIAKVLHSQAVDVEIEKIFTEYFDGKNEVCSCFEDLVDFIPSVKQTKQNWK